MVMNSDRGAMRYWLSIYSRVSNKISLRFKYTHDRNYPITFIQARDSNNEVIGPGNASFVEGQYYQGYDVQQSQEYYYLDFNFHF